MNFFFCFKSKSLNKPENFDLVIIEDSKQHIINVKKTKNSFSVTINGSYSTTVDDTFNLSDHVIKTKLGQDDKVTTMQLISKEGSGEINLQYMGTKVDYYFL